MLSDALWRRMGADPGIIGRSLPLDDVERGQSAYEVLGVMPPDFAYPIGAARPTDIWIPHVVPANHRRRDPASRTNYLQTIARLKPGVSLSLAQAQMDQVALAIEQANPEWNKGNRIGVRPLIDHIVGSRTRSWMLMLLAAVGIVLVIACANVANLILARGAARERDIGIRAALGASRSRLVRQMLAESLLLSAAGTACAVVAAWWGVRVLRGALPEDLPRVTTVTLDFRVLAAAAALSIVTAVLFGLVPALQLSKPDLTTALKEGSRGSARCSRDCARGRPARWCGAIHRQFHGGPRYRRRVRRHQRTHGAGVAAGRAGGPTRQSGRGPRRRRRPPLRNTGRSPRRADFRRVTSRLRHERDDVCGARAEPDPGGGRRHQHSEGDAGIPPGDGYSSSPRPTVRSSRFDGSRRRRHHQRRGGGDVLPWRGPARPGGDPLRARTIVGVVGNVHQTSLETAPRVEAYVPLAQSTAFGGELVIRTAGHPYSVLPQVKAAVFGVLPNVPLRNVRTMEEVIARRLAQRRLNMLLLGLFGLLGLAISAVGVYGVMAYVVSQRTREIGVRMALGATRARVMVMVLGNAAIRVVTGLVLGGCAAWYLSAAAGPFLFHLQPTDPRAYASAMLLLSASALAATVIPARRAASVDPMTALRAE